ncbi:MAG: hypothetical protein HQ557_14360 [Bacteroidetes bacterium]|nr:hypothetical protein [Bacteroidota bacterium]
MSKAIKHIYKLHNNPFFLTPVIIGFYNKYHSQDKNLLLAYLILPLVLHDETKNWLKKAIASSSLSSFGRKKENYYGLPDRLVEYKHLTNQCLQYAQDNKLISIHEDLSVEVLSTELRCSGQLKDSLKASENFVKIIKDLDVITIYRLLGVKSL